MNNQTSAIERAIQQFSAHAGILSTGQSLALGIAPRTLYSMRDSGLIRQISRGVYQLAVFEPIQNPDLVITALRIPKAVICLTTALNHYGITTQIPRKVFIALPRDAEKPRMEYPPLDIIWLSHNSYSAGISVQTMDGIPVKIYSLEKTIADCFKFRNKIGEDVALEALKEYLNLLARDLEQLIMYLKIDRVESMVEPYLRALI
jgi:predicted transcriptional regulator of viral defense system